MNFKPHQYQIEAINFIKAHEKCALFLDMGLGKTVSTLTALNDLNNEYEKANPKTANRFLPINGKSSFTYSVDNLKGKSETTANIDKSKEKKTANLILHSVSKKANPILPKCENGKSLFTFSLSSDCPKTCSTYHVDGRSAKVGTLTTHRYCYSCWAISF